MDWLGRWGFCVHTRVWILELAKFGLNFDIHLNILQNVTNCPVSPKILPFFQIFGRFLHGFSTWSPRRCSIRLSIQRGRKLLLYKYITKPLLQGQQGAYKYCNFIALKKWVSHYHCYTWTNDFVPHDSFSARYSFFFFCVCEFWWFMEWWCNFLTLLNRELYLRIQ